MKASDLKKYGPPLALALLMALVGFWLFIKPHLGSKITYPAIAADAKTRSVAANAISELTANAQAASLEALAKGKGLDLVVSAATSADHVAGGRANQLEVQISGNTPAVLNFLADLAGHVYVDNRQLRGNGGSLYLVNTLDCELESKSCKVTILVPTLNSSAITPTTTTSPKKSRTTRTQTTAKKRSHGPVKKTAKKH